MTRRRVVITGLGTVNPLGRSIDEFWKNAQAGVSGIGPITLFDPAPFTSRIAGEVKDWDPEVYRPRRESRRLDRSAQFFVVAVDQALADAGISYEEADPAAVELVDGEGCSWRYSTRSRWRAWRRARPLPAAIGGERS